MLFWPDNIRYSTNNCLKQINVFIFLLRDCRMKCVPENKVPILCLKILYFFNTVTFYKYKDVFVN